ncbi:MAG TPA: undecaprenyldiphospho-muramoylpentapeptide beta-N-acetylglucosaminyltransferase [Candidatus Omnitrophota bacterium]|nr:undecaprenyldiphospho-muramoylpentapeptide beta-N-acetylglucosaminyltransferase [Candidatus Omnitrophota bacterium]HPT06881.1 undecaprenyldiphospho-muramoylpentapeptide beta-N-acetylglucosaminyltransferase [Candidatus Omnitrophota bacterium]
MSSSDCVSKRNPDQEQGLKVLVVTGASGGHIFPAVSFIDSLKQRYPDSHVLLVLPRKNAAGTLKNCRCQTRYLDLGSLRIRFNRSAVYGFFHFAAAFWRSFKLILSFRPDIVVGFGTCACIPVFFNAWLLRIKTLLHEQNVLPGKANKVLAVFADAIAVSFAKTKSCWSTYARKIEVTGNPLRKELVVQDKSLCRELFALDKHRFTILVAGGSQASKTINTVFMQAAKQLRQNNVSFQVLHLAGQADAAGLSGEYLKNGICACVLSFCDTMERAYSAADCAVTRAGATTVTELMRFALPAILIPYPYAHEHQLANARLLSDAQAAILAEESDLSADKLAAFLEGLISDPAKLERMGQAAASLEQKDAAGMLVEYAIRVVRC